MLRGATCNAAKLLRQHKSITVQCLRRSIPAAAELNDTVRSAGLAAGPARVIHPEREGEETGGFHFTVGKETQTHLGEQLGFIAQLCLSKALSQELSLVLGKGMEECGMLRTDKN